MISSRLRALTARVPAGTRVFVELPAEGGGVVLVALADARVETVPVDDAEVKDWPEKLILKLEVSRE
ncbi:hypothetical protein BH11PLA2_BH11PLA2_32680 [soil metagenome]